MAAVLLPLLLSLSHFIAPCTSLVVAPRQFSSPFIILPGFSNASQDYDDFRAGLSRRSIYSSVLPLERTEWFKCLSGVASAAFWTSTASPPICYGWYLQKVRQEVKEQYESSGSKVVLIGHSAGGWLLRAAMGDGTEIWGENGETVVDMVLGVVTLGAPHSAPEGMDMTRGALTYTDNIFPGAFLQSKGINYITVAGDICTADKDAPRGDRSRFAFNSYAAVCGIGDGVGDGCVPLSAAHLNGAKQVNLRCWHSIDKPDLWYGAEGVMDKWLSTVFSSIIPPKNRIPRFWRA
jgi:hypothetical protein